MGAKLRAIVSTLMLFLGLFQAVTGIILYSAPHGRYSGELIYLLLPKRDWVLYHTYTGFLLIALAILHFSLNWKMYVSELKKIF